MNDERRDAARAAVDEKSGGESHALALRERKKELLSKVEKGLDAQTPRLQAYLAKLQGDPDRFRSTVLQAVSTTPTLLECTPNSIVIAALEAAQLGLEPTGILGGAYMLPYRNRDAGTTEAKLIVGYRGYIDLIHRAGAVKSIEARVVYEGDLFEVEYGTAKRIRHVPYFLVGNDAGDRRCVYWIAETANETQFDVLPMTEIEKARRSSKSKDRGPWIDWYDEMAKKTAIRRAVKILAISVYEARRAVQLEDEAEETAAPIQANVEKPSATARDRAVALLDGDSGEDRAGQDVAGEEQAPDDRTTDESTGEDTARVGRPSASEALTPEEEAAERAKATDSDEDLPGG